ncbi:MAG: hypothetical protein AABX52_03985 [Nanoarchaeota archaeon]
MQKSIIFIILFILATAQVSALVIMKGDLKGFAPKRLRYVGDNRISVKSTVEIRSLPIPTKKPHLYIYTKPIPPAYKTGTLIKGVYGKPTRWK